MVLTSNRCFAEWGEVFGDPVVATASSIGCSTTTLSSRLKVRATGSVNTPILYQSTFDFKARAYHRVQASPVTCQPFRYRTPSGDLE